MTDFLKIESDANRLRQAVRAAWASELKLLCVIRFFERHADAEATQLEPYLREFAPIAAVSAVECSTEELLPDEVDALTCFIALLGRRSDGVAAEQDFEALQVLEGKAREYLTEVTRQSDIRQSTACDNEISCLFVEHYPDLGLEPRGRIMRLGVVGSSAPTDSKDDIITLDNPIEKRDDRFLAQARQSVAVARESLGQFGKLYHISRFRFEFSLDTSGARFT